VVNKVSQNLHAELVKLAAGGEDAMKTFLIEAGVEKAGEKFPETRLQDGSGMSRLNLITPRGTTRLLAYLARSPHGALFESLLPIGGQDGTLAGRFEGMKNADRIHAKTGTLTQVLALSGFTTTRRKEKVVFSIFLNGALGSGLEYRKLMDKIAITLTE
jgi:D-alanyl-D-alanine carboxypeptidase/D-alanyl-D-alanine-endopeptidase (penicillin-binding protein 4)